MRACIRWSLCGVALVAGLVVAGDATAVEWRLLSESSDGLRLQIEIRVAPPLRTDTEIDGVRFSRYDVAGTRLEASPGAPELAAATRWIALPPGGAASVRVLEAEIVELGTVQVAPRPLQRVRYGPGASPDDPSSGMPVEEFVFEAERYQADGALRDPVRLGEVAHLRHQRVVPVHVYPLLYDPATLHLRSVRRLRIEVTLRPGRVTSAGGGTAAQALAATPRSWRRIYDATVLNATSGRRWLSTPARQEPRIVPSTSGLLRPGLLAEDAWRLRVRRTGPVRVEAATLIAAGFEDGRPIEDVRLVIRRYNPATPLVDTVIEIPIHVEDNDRDGMFRAGDAFVFVAEHPRDDDTAGERAARYSFDNVYWLMLADSGTPARMPVRAPLVGTTPGPTSFEREIVVEEDNAINLWVNCDEGELYFTLERSETEARLELPLHARSAGADVHVCVETQQDWMQRPFRMSGAFAGGPRLPLGSHPGANPNVGNGVCPAVVELCATIPAADVGAGNLTLILEPNACEDPNSRLCNDVFTDTTPYVDRVTLEYVSDYVARDDALQFTSGGATGATAFTINGLSGAALLALDVTDRKQPAWFDLTGAVANGTLTLTDDIPVATLRTYQVMASAAVPTLASENIERDTPDPILDELANLDVISGYDVLVVAYDDFAQDPALLEWKAFREAQGHRVRIIATQDVYDAFNGGLLHYDPIYNLVRVAYDNWGLAYLMLVGDGSEDAAGLRPTSGPNMVPSAMRYFQVLASSGGGPEYRNDMHERYYAKMNDFDRPPPRPLETPDLLVGRLPASNAQELRNMVDKIVRYEQPLDGDDSNWRKRVVLFSDDEWVARFLSDGSGIGHVRGDRCAEWDFFRSIKRTCEIVDAAFPGDLQCVPFYLHEFSDRLATSVDAHAPWSPDSLPVSCEDPVYLAEHRPDFSETVFYINVGEALADSVGEGALFFALQSHANRAVVADEQIITRGVPFKPAYHNDGKPFVFFGFGCHLNEFGVVGENAMPFGDAIGELYVTVPNNAAIASYASTGFEFLRENNRFHENMWATIFNKLYGNELGGGQVDSDTLEANWRLSTLTQIAEIWHGNQAIIDRYALMGDPLLQLDAGVPRFVVDVTGGTLYEDGRIRPDDPAQPIEFSVTVNDEQGIDSLWVEQRFESGAVVPVTDVFITANVDTAAQILHKRSYTLEFSLLFGECDFNVAVGARDVAGRTSEWLGLARLEQRVLANGLVVQSGDRVDKVSAFRYELEDCARDELPLTILQDSEPLPIQEKGLVDGVWFADFAWDAQPGVHKLQFELDGAQVFEVDLEVAGRLGLRNVLAFPNPFEGETRIFFDLQTQIAGGMLRIMDLNGRVVRHFDLAQPGVVQVLTSASLPAGSVGSSQYMNYVVWDGTDRAGDQVANGVYLYELRIEDAAGGAMRTRDKLVVMN